MKVLAEVSILFLIVFLPGCSEVEKKEDQFPKKPPTTEESAQINGLLDKLRTGERPEKIEAAKALGDMAIAKPGLGLGASERKELDEIIDGYLADAGNKTDHQKRIFAKEQLERIWTFASDRLIGVIGGKKDALTETAVKQLILMRNDEVCEKLMKKFRAGDDETRWMVAFTFSKMKGKRTAMVKGRTCADEKETERLLKEKIIPFLKEVHAAEKSEKVKKTIEKALRDFTPPEGM